MLLQLLLPPLLPQVAVVQALLPQLLLAHVPLLWLVPP
jgi:hypothetical protein